MADINVINDSTAAKLYNIRNSIRIIGNDLQTKPHHDICFTAPIPASKIRYLEGMLFEDAALNKWQTNGTSNYPVGNLKIYGPMKSSIIERDGSIELPDDNCTIFIPYQVDKPGYFDDMSIVNKQSASSATAKTFSDVWHDTFSIVGNGQGGVIPAPLLDGMTSSGDPASSDPFSMFVTIGAIPKSSFPSIGSPTIKEETIDIPGESGKFDNSYVQNGALNYENISGSMDFILPKQDIYTSWTNKNDLQYGYNYRDNGPYGYNWGGGPKLKDYDLYTYHSEYDYGIAIKHVFNGTYRLAMLEDSPGWWYIGRWWISSLSSSDFGYDFTLSYDVHPFATCLHKAGEIIWPPGINDNTRRTESIYEYRTVGVIDQGTSGLHGCIFISAGRSVTLPMSSFWCNGPSVRYALSLRSRGSKTYSTNNALLVCTVSSDGREPIYVYTNSYFFRGNGKEDNMANMVYDDPALKASRSIKITNKTDSTLEVTIILYPKRVG